MADRDTRNGLGTELATVRPWVTLALVPAPMTAIRTAGDGRGASTPIAKVWSPHDAALIVQAVNEYEDIERERQVASEMAAFIGSKGLGDEFVGWVLSRRAAIDHLLAEDDDAR